MTKPFSHLSPIPRRHLLPLTLLTCALMTGCQSPGFATALSGKNADARTVSSTASTESTEAGLPEPTNTASSNSPLSLSSVDEHLRLGEQELAAGNLQQAQMHFEHVLKKHPEHAKAHHRLGVLADKLSKFEQAEQHYLTALAEDPRNAALLSDLGYSYFMQGRHADAERYLLESRKVDPQYDTAIANLGLLYGSTGRKQEALALFRRIGDDQQVQAIMKQIDGGEFGPSGMLASNTTGSRQSSTGTMPSSVQQSPNPGSGGLHHDPAQDFAEQLQKAREELRRAEEEFARHQQAQQSQHGQLAQTGPQQPAWVEQTPSSHHQPPPQQPSWQNQQMPPQQAPPSGDAARFDALASREQSFAPAGANNSPVTLGPQNVVGPLPEVTPGERYRSAATTHENSAAAQHPLSTHNSVPAQTGDSRNQPAASFGSQQFATNGTRSQPQQASLAGSPWGQTSAQPGGAANAVATSPQNSREVPPAAWGQQFSNTVEQSGGQGTSNAPQSIQQLSGNAHPPGQQRPVEHAYHTQQQHAQNNVTLAGQQRPASAGPLPQIGNQRPDSQSNNGYGSAGASSSPANAYDAARREAALMGLNAGPGQTFPYVQRYERTRSDAGSHAHGANQHHGGQQNYGAPQPPAGQAEYGGPQHAGPPQGMTSAQASAAAAQQPQQWSPQHNAAPQDVSRHSASPQNTSQDSQQWQPQPQQTGMGPQDSTSAPSTWQSEDQFTQAWGQPPSGPYGVDPSTTTHNYRPSPTPAAQYSPPSQVTPAPYYERTTGNAHGGVVPTGYESPAPPTSYAPQQASSGGVVPEAYWNRQPAPGGSVQPSAMQHPQAFQQQHQTHQPPAQQPQSNQRPYAGPMIVPGER